MNSQVTLNEGELVRVITDLATARKAAWRGRKEYQQLIEGVGLNVPTATAHRWWPLTKEGRR